MKTQFELLECLMLNILIITQDAKRPASSFSWKRDPGRTWHVKALIFQIPFEKLTK